MRIAFVTWSGEPDLTADDTLAAVALSRLGHLVSTAPWDSPVVNWREHDVAVLRSTWNYHHALDAFMRWLDALEAAGVVLLNPVPLVRWNAHKAYLLALRDAGIRVPETVLIARDAGRAELDALGSRSWTEVVIKPAVSANAHKTERMPSNPLAFLRERVAALASHGDVLVQELVPEVGHIGEHSIVFFNGAFSHAVLKRPGAGDFRVQEKFGGTNVLVDVDEELMRACRQILEALPAVPAYVRLDVVRAATGCMLMEVEAIEPTLFLGMSRGAADRFARAILAHAPQHAAR